MFCFGVGCDIRSLVFQNDNTDSVTSVVWKKNLKYNLYTDKSPPFWVLFCRFGNTHDQYIIKIQEFHRLKNFPSGPSVRRTPLLVLAAPDVFVTIVLSFLEFYINGIMQYVTFWGWLLLFNTNAPRNIHTLCIRDYFLLLKHPIVWMYPSFLIHVPRSLGGLQFLITMPRAGINIFTHMYVCAHINVVFSHGLKKSPGA